MAINKQIIIHPKVAKNHLAKFVKNLEDEGIRIVFTDPKSLGKTKIQTIFPSQNADYVILDKPATKKLKGKKIGRRFKVLSNKDIENILDSAKKGLDFVIIEVKDWKIIPLENIIAKLHKMHTKIFSIARNAKEARKMFSILDVGVDGVIFNTDSMNEVRQALVYLGSKSFELSSAKIVEIQEVGDGERVCVDTASMLNRGEGMLIGSRANFLFLVHNESVGSSFTSPRPFRVNAGAVHCYTLAPDGTTKYLSELETGVEILVLDSKGKARRATIGRCKIEKRPMLMIKAKVGEEVGGIIAQDAETIRFVKPNGHLVSVTHLKKGDSVLVHSKAATGRHFGMEISDEYILEK
uniref:3-dehydroquinate synthase n=1 Tax=uncultured marine thaumarchaeote KM3_87_E01 TaxID=1456328 RepID=A0A075I0V0_9ARCH|nr:3-dehydroquinate synthase [uncultured marine thaumarchaeote KM3_87_E01]